MTSSYYRGAHGLLVVFDVCNLESFKSVERWIQEASSYSDQPLIIYLIGNKIDRESSRTVSVEMAHSLISRLNQSAQYSVDGYFEVSAKQRDGVRDLFASVVDRIVDSGISNVDPTRLRLDSTPKALGGYLNCSC